MKWRGFVLAVMAGVAATLLADWIRENVPKPRPRRDVLTPWS
jgi:hypothetical protein